jgi:hypothetical protein
VPAPLLILGVSRSGTTLLRVMLDRNSRLAVPDESFFVPLLADRHLRRVDADEFVDDVRRLRTVEEWGVPLDKLRARLTDGMPIARAIAAIYEVYAAEQGKPRWGDKTPMYMRHLPLLERLFPAAQYVHLIRDGRDAALSFLRMPSGTFTRTWAHPDSAAEFACLWRTEVSGARELGRRVGPTRYLEVRYEDLVAGPEDTVRRICDFANLPYEPSMLDYAGAIDVSGKPHQQRLLQPLTPRARDWRTQLSAGDVRAFESIAGDLLRDLGYELAEPRAQSGWRATLVLARYRAAVGAWNAAVSAMQRSPLWRRRHPPLTTPVARPARGRP